MFLCTDVKDDFLDYIFDLLLNEWITIHFKTEADNLEDLQLKSFNNFIR